MNKNINKIAKKSHVWHNIKRGILFEAYYDTETTGLDRRFIDLTEFGGIITDIAGNVLYSAEYKGKLTDYNVFSPKAWATQRADLEEIYEGDPYPILAAKIKRFFEWSNKPADAPFHKDFLKSCKFIKDGKNGAGYYYPLMNDDGTIDYDSVRVSGNYLEYKHDVSGEWIRKKIASNTNGYNNIRADDNWIWTVEHMGLADNIFVSHLKMNGHYRNDVKHIVEAVAEYSNNDNIFKPGYTVDPKTGKNILSFRQSKVIEANTRIPDQKLGIAEGIVLPDGSYFDVSQAHGALADVMALAGLKNYVREHFPHIVQQMEMNSDWTNLRDRLTMTDKDYGMNPVHTYIDKSYPYLNSTLVRLVTNDTARHQPKLALLANVCIDPNKKHIAGKSIEEASVEELATLIQNSQKSPNGIFKIVELNKQPRILDKETGFDIGAHQDIPLNIIRKNQRFYDKPSIQKKLNQALQLARPQFDRASNNAFVQAEEQIFNFATPEMEDQSTGDRVQLYQNRDTALQDKVYVSRQYIFKQRNYWLQALHMNHSIFLDEFSSLEDEQNAAITYAESMSKIAKKLHDSNMPILPAFNGREFYDVYPGGRGSNKLKHDIASGPKGSAYLNALTYHMRLLLTARAYFSQGVLQNIGQNFWFEMHDNNSSYRLEYEDVKQWPQWKIDRDYRSLDVVHEQSPEIIERIDRMIESLGYAHLLNIDIQQSLADLKSIRIHGINNGLSDERYTTLKKVYREIESIKNNENRETAIKSTREDEIGDFEIFMTDLSGKQKMIGDYETYIEQLKDKYPPPSPTVLARRKINPATHQPIEHVEHTVDINNITILDVPDRILENPVREPNTGKIYVAVPLTNKFNDHSKVKATNKDICLRGDKLGKINLAVGGKFVSHDESYKFHKDFYQKMKMRYLDSGIDWSENYALLEVENIYPIHNIRPINFKAQNILVPQNSFESLISPELAGHKYKSQGFVLQDDVINIKAEDVRILETHENKITGWEFETKIKSANQKTLKQVKRMSDRTAQKYGFISKSALVDHFEKTFSDLNKNPKSQENTLWFIEFDKIDISNHEKSVAYYNPTETKFAGIKIDYDKVANLMEAGYTPKQALEKCQKTLSL